MSSTAAHGGAAAALRGLLDLEDEALCAQVPYALEAVTGAPAVLAGRATPLGQWLDRCRSLLAAGPEEHRWAGCVLLEATLPHASQAQLKAGHARWTQHLAAAMGGRGSPSPRLVAAAARCSVRLFEVARRWPDVRRAVVLAAAPKLVPPLVTAAGAAASPGPLLDALASCLLSLRSSARPFISRVDAACLPLLDSPRPGVAAAAARCVAALGSSLAAEPWAERLARVAGSLAALASRYLDGAAVDTAPILAGAPGSGDDEAVPELALEPLAGRGTALAMRLRVRFSSLALCARLSLTEAGVHGGDGAAAAPAGLLLAVAECCLRAELAAGALEAGFQGAELSAVGLWTVLPALQRDALALVDAVTRAAGRSALVPYGRRLAALLVDLLRRGAAARVPSEELLSGTVRAVAAAAHCLGGSSRDALAAPAVPLLLDLAARPFRLRYAAFRAGQAAQLGLGGAGGAGGAGSKKGSGRGGRGKRRRLEEAIDLSAFEEAEAAAKAASGTSSSSSVAAAAAVAAGGAAFAAAADEPTGAVDVADRLAEAALGALRLVLEACGAMMPSAPRASVDTTLASLLLSSAVAGERPVEAVGAPPAVRAALYAALGASALCPLATGARSPAVPLAARLLAEGSLDPSLEVRVECVRALAAVQAVCQPHGPPLAAVQADDEVLPAYALSVADLLAGRSGRRSDEEDAQLRAPAAAPAEAEAGADAEAGAEADAAVVDAVVEMVTATEVVEEIVSATEEAAVEEPPKAEAASPRRSSRKRSAEAAGLPAAEEAAKEAEAAPAGAGKAEAEAEAAAEDEEEEEAAPVAKIEPLGAFDDDDDDEDDDEEEAGGAMQLDDEGPDEDGDEGGSLWAL